MTDSRQLRGTDETFLQLMQLSGAGLLKLAGFAADVAESYQFRAVEFKEKNLQRPDVEGLPILETVNTRVTLEFQGYTDKYIRYRCLNNMLQICLKSRDDKPVVGIIVYTHQRYQQAALKLETLIPALQTAHTSLIQEIVLTEYTEQQLITADPRLIVLAPFTLAINTEKPLLQQKMRGWCEHIYQHYPAGEQLNEALNIIGLLLLNRFKHLEHQEVIDMLNLDLLQNDSIRKLYQTAKAEGKVEGKLEAEQQFCLQTQEKLIKHLKQRFKKLPASVKTAISQITNFNQIIELTGEAYSCASLDDFMAKANMFITTDKKTKTSRPARQRATSKKDEQ